MKQKLSNLWGKDGTKSVLASLISILIGMVVGALIIIIVGAANPSLGLNSAWEGIRLVFGGLFSTGRDAAGTLTFGFNSTNLGNMLFRATPLILTGLSVAVAFKTGLFNIGAPGQYLMGTAATLILALTIPTETVPAPLVWLIAFLGGMLAGALWGCIPGLVKAFLNINEVLACIMTNWIAANLVTWLFDKGSLFESLQNHVENTKTAYIYKTSFNGVETAKLGLDKLFPNSQVNGGILIAIGIAILIYILMNKTTWATSSRPAAPTATRPGTPALPTSGTSSCPWPSPGPCPARPPPCTTCRATRSFSGLPTRPFPPPASMAFPWPCWPSAIPSV